MNPENAFEACKQTLKMKSIQFKGLHIHFKGQNTHSWYLTEPVREVIDFAGKLKKELNIRVEEIDFGGGFPWGRKEGYGPGGNDKQVPPVEEFADVIINTLRDNLRKYGLSEPTIELEPGRYMVASAVVLLGRVGIIKEDVGVKKWVHIDTSINHLVRVSTANWYYHIVCASNADAGPQEIVDICGPTCQASDILGVGRNLPKLQSGDIVALLDTGAYAESTACTFNTIPRPASVLAYKGISGVITERESIQDIIKRYKVPARLASNRAT